MTASAVLPPRECRVVVRGLLVGVLGVAVWLVVACTCCGGLNVWCL